eukprot:PhM_4_TR10044/c3_g3_i3/m.65568
MEDVVKCYDVDTAAKIIAHGKPPPDVNGGAPQWTKSGYRRSKKYAALAYAINNLDEGSIKRSWERTGNTTLALGVKLCDEEVEFDNYVKALRDWEEMDFDCRWQRRGRIFSTRYPRNSSTCHCRTCSATISAAKARCWTPEGNRDRETGAFKV